MKYSIIVPVLHEGKRVHDLVAYLEEIDPHRDCEIIVVDGSQQQDTLGAIETQQVKKVSSERGRGKQMNVGASVARGEVLIFLHADTELPRQALALIDAVMKKKGYVGGAFDLGIKSDRKIFKAIGVLASVRSRLNGIPYGDQALFFRRDYFNRIGGFKEIPLMEDVELIRRVRKSGGKIWLIPERVLTSPRRWEKEGVIYCTLRNWTLFILYLLGTSPEKLVKYYRSYRG